MSKKAETLIINGKVIEPPPELRHNIFREISGSDKIPETSVEAWAILTRNKKIAVQAKSYGGTLVLKEGSIFDHDRYSNDLDAEIDAALK